MNPERADLPQSIWNEQVLHENTPLMQQYTNEERFRL